jgi:hypothetical protein
MDVNDTVASATVPKFSFSLLRWVEEKVEDSVLDQIFDIVVVALLQEASGVRT